MTPRAVLTSNAARARSTWATVAADNIQRRHETRWVGAQFHPRFGTKCLSCSKSLSRLANASSWLGHPPPPPVLLHTRGMRLTAANAGDIKVVECPAFAESISEGDIRFEKQVGDSVAQDEVICEVETDKTSVPVPSPVAGVLKKWLVEDESTVNPGMKLAEIEEGAAGAAPAPAKPKEEPAPAAAAAAPPPPPPPAAAAAPPTPTPIPTTPPPTPPTPTGPSASVPPPPPRQAAPPQSTGPAPIVRLPPADPTTEIAGTRSEHRVKMNRMRQKIAKTLKDAQNTNAMLTTFNELDMRFEFEPKLISQTRLR